MRVATRRNRFILLDGIASWREAKLERIEILEPEKDLRLESIPGTLQPFLADQQGAIELAGAVAIDGERTLVADRATGLIHVLGRGPLRGVGGIGRGTRRIRDPRGLAVLSDGSIAVSDAANGRVQIFGPLPHPLLQLWASPQVSRPWGLAVDRCDVLYIADRDAARIHRFTRHGRDLGALTSPELREPTEIALFPLPAARGEGQGEGCSGRVGRPLSLTLSPQAGRGELAVVDSGRIVLLHDDETRVIDVPGVTSVAFDDRGGLYAGTSDGLIHKFLDGREVGVAVSGHDGAIVQLRFDRSIGLVAIVEDEKGARVWRGGVAESFVADGTYLTDVIDSGIESCEWHRLVIEGEIPSGSSIEVVAETSDRVDALETATFSRQHAHLLGGETKDCLLLTTPGQFLRLRFRLRSSATASPRIHAVRVHFPRESYLQYLPAVYQEDPVSREFLGRFLSIFQTSFDDLDEHIDNLWQLFEPMAVPRRYLPWLAGWLAVPLSPDWSEAKTREVLDRAFHDAQRRGTAEGLERSIADYAGVEAHVVEHFKLRRWMHLGDARLNRSGAGSGSRLWSRAVYDRMQLESWSRIGYFHLRGAPEPGIEPADWGANEFSVFYVTSPYTTGEDAKNVARVVEREKPVHTRAFLCPVQPRMRIGVQSTIGVDSVVGDISHLVLGSLSTLGYDSILACASFEHSARASGGSIRPRAGVSTQLL